MKVIEIFENGVLLGVSAHDENTNYVVKNTPIEILDNLNKRKINEIKLVGNDQYFICSDITVIIKNYVAVKENAMYKDFNNKVHEVYRMEKLRRTTVRNFKMVGALAVVSLAATVAFSLNSKAENTTTNSNSNSNPSYSTSGIQIYDPQKEADSDDSYDDWLVQNNVNNENAIKLDYEDHSLAPNASLTKAQYGETIAKYASMYGVDANVMNAIAMAGDGIHTTGINQNGTVGLMYVPYDTWINQELCAYNYETGEYDVIVVDDQNINDLESNIRFGCMIMQLNLEVAKGNPFVAIQSYSSGYSNVLKALESYGATRGLSVEQVLNNYYDIGWLTEENNIYRENMQGGDPRFVENVLSFIGPKANLEFKTQTNDVNITVEQETAKTRS